MGILSLALVAALTLAPIATDPESRDEPGLGVDLAGETWTVADLEGRVVVLDFWATWCPPCLADLPHWRRLAERFAESDLVLLGVALDTIDRRGLRSFLLRHEVSWPQIHEPRGVESELAERFEVTAVPATRLFDRRGRLVGRDLRGRALEAAVETLVDLDPATAERRPRRPM